jgi:hypothetical protein
VAGKPNYQASFMNIAPQRMGGVGLLSGLMAGKCHRLVLLWATV